MDFVLSKEQEMARTLFKEFAENEVKPLAQEVDETEHFPRETVEKMQKLGFMGIPQPKEYGGQGCDTLTYVLCVEELSKVCATTGVIVSAHTSLGTDPIKKFGTPEQKEKYLRPLASGKMLGAFGLTEPGAGTDAQGQQTKAVLDGDEWVINGSKAFITNSTYATTFLVAAKTDMEAKGSRGISIFIVPAGTPGFEVGKPEEKMSNRSSYSCPLTFTDVRIPKENLLGELNRGFPLFMKCIDDGRVAISAVAVGMAQGVLERAAKYSKERVTFGKPICENQAIAFKLAEMATQIDVARAMLYNTARMSDNGVPFSKEATMTKLFCSEMCVRVCDMVLQIMGGYGLCDDYQVERMYRDAKLLTIGEGTSEICRMVIGRHVLKEY